jgi:hypothetical protein
MTIVRECRDERGSVCRGLVHPSTHGRVGIDRGRLMLINTHAHTLYCTRGPLLLSLHPCYFCAQGLPRASVDVGMHPVPTDKRMVRMQSASGFSVGMVFIPMDTHPIHTPLLLKHDGAPKVDTTWLQDGGREGRGGVPLQSRPCPMGGRDCGHRITSHHITSHAHAYVHAYVSPRSTGRCP